MHKKKIMSLILSLTLGVSGVAFMPLSSVSEVRAAEVSGAAEGTVLAAFENPDADAKPMVRWWFTDSWAGEDEDDMIEEHIRALAEAGYGGVEITLLASGTSMSNDELADYGWGTENYVNLLKKVLRAANEIEGGFTVDITVTAHWPTVMNNIDPNDDAASQELVYTMQEAVLSEDGTGISLVLPETKTTDSADALTAAPFIFTDTLVASYLVKAEEPEASEEAAAEVSESAPEEAAAEEPEGFGSSPEEAEAEEPEVSESVPEEAAAEEPEGSGSAPEEAAAEEPEGSGSAPEAVAEEAEGSEIAPEASAEGAIPEGEFPAEGFPEGGMGEETPSVTYDYDTAINVTDYITQTEYAKAGVPDEETCEAYGLDYGLVLEIYGEAPAEDADLSQSFNGKQDSEGNRARMADTQYAYTLDTAQLSEEVQEYIASGEYVLVNTYVRGTGQIMSDGPFGGASDAMYARTYVTNYFTQDGTDAILSYWEENILTDEELVSLLEENGSSIFEDSIEASTKSGGSFWSNAVLKRYAEDYGEDLSEMLPLIVALSGSLTSDTLDVSDAQTSYQMTLGNLYDEQHSAKISEWASTFNYSYRAQCYAVTGQDICGSEMATDIPEGDNSSKGDGLRKMASVVNVEGKESFSMEAVTATGNAQLNWADVATEVGQNYSDGVNHVVLHGMPYTKSVTGYLADWPGWTAFGNNFAGSYAIWRCDWEDMTDLTGYMARTQAVFQNGTAKVDLIFLNDTTTGASLTSGNAFQELLNAGYSYNMMTEALLKSENAVVTNGVLAEDGPAYQALILNSVSVLSVSAMETLVSYAGAGLPIVLYNTEVSDIYGLESGENTQEALLALYAQLQAFENVRAAASEEELLSVLAELGVSSAAQSDASYLEISRYQDALTGSNYYYVYNNPQEAVDSSSSVQTGKNATFKAAGSTTATLTLIGEGVPCELNAWTGEITKIAGYTDNGDGTISVQTEVAAGDSIIIALLSEADSESIAADEIYVQAADRNVSYDSEGNLVYRTAEAVDTTLTLSDGTAVEVAAEAAPDTLDLSDGWSLTIESWGPSAAIDEEDNINQEKTAASSTGNTVYIDPTMTDVITETFAIDTLTLWENIEATDGQLEELGVDSMGDISGIGYYTNTFTLPEGWSEATGAVLHLEYSQDMILGVTVNGSEIEVVDNVSDQVDIGAYLVEGENTIEIKLSTPMYKRMLASGRQAIGLEGDMNMSTMAGEYSNGLVSVTLEPYTETLVYSAAEAG